MSPIWKCIILCSSGHYLWDTQSTGYLLLWRRWKNTAQVFNQQRVKICFTLWSCHTILVFSGHRKCMGFFHVYCSKQCNYAFWAPFKAIIFFSHVFSLWGTCEFSSPLWLVLNTYCVPQIDGNFPTSCLNKWIWLVVSRLDRWPCYHRFVSLFSQGAECLHSWNTVCHQGFHCTWASFIFRLMFTSPLA